jgi:predicted CoA-binding protein
MKRTLIVGATPNSDRYSYIATEMLLAYGHEVVPFGIRKGNIGLNPIVNEWPLDEQFNTVTLYVNPSMQEEYIPKIVALKPERVIFNPGTENREFASMLSSVGIEAVEACTLVMLRTNQY